MAELDNTSQTQLDIEQDAGWLETDLSNLGEYEPYEWATGELEQRYALEIDSDRGVVIIKDSFF